MTQAPADQTAILTTLYDIILERKNDTAEKSYTASLLAKGTSHCARKFGEEAVETIIAGINGTDQELVSESADTLYHLLVLLAARNIPLKEVTQELANRQGISGHEEKAGRK